MANAAVFPVPVCAQPIISDPESIIGMACCWIGVGVEYPFFQERLRSALKDRVL